MKDTLRKAHTTNYTLYSVHTYLEKIRIERDGKNLQSRNKNELSFWISIDP